MTQRRGVFYYLLISFSFAILQHCYSRDCYDLRISIEILHTLAVLTLCNVFYVNFFFGVQQALKRILLLFNWIESSSYSVFLSFKAKIKAK